MYKLDSGLISIISIIIAIIIGVYSAIDKKQKEKAARKSRIYGERRVDMDYIDNVEDKEIEEKEEDFQIFNNPFEQFFGVKREEVFDNKKLVSKVAVEEDELFSFANKPVEVKPLNKIKDKADEFQYCNGMESVENAVDFYKDGMTEATAFVEMVNVADDVIENEEIGSKNENMERRTAGKDLKGRLKLNPKDVILFSEILKPKYQDF